MVPGDTYLELGTDGRLVELRVVPSRRDAASRPTGAIDWSSLFAAARLDPGRMTPVEPAWGPAHAFDTRAAWEAALDAEPVIVEAAARHGRATYFRVSPSWMALPRGPDSTAPRAFAYQQWLNTILILGSIAFLGALAARNLRLGRGDRRGAFRLAAFMSAALAVGNALSRHWTAASSAAGTVDPVVPRPGAVGPAQQVLATFGPALFLALAVWLTYVGFEPYARRRWPHLLIASARLLDGRWRDPLVGRSLIAGVAGAIATFIVISAGFGVARLAGWGGVVPTFAAGTLDGLVPFAGFVARYSSVNGWLAVIFPAVLLLARLALRRNEAAWAGLALVCLAMFAAWGRIYLGPEPAVVAPFAIILTIGSVLMLSKGGLLTLVVWLAVIVVLRDTPWTSALTRWYAGPTWLSAALLAGLLLWGFRNVLGRQSMFAAEP